MRAGTRSERRAGPETANVSVDLFGSMGKTGTPWEASDTSTEAAHRGNGAGTHVRSGKQQHGKPCRCRGTRQPGLREEQTGLAG